MEIEIRVGVGKLFGVGSLQGTSGSLQRYISQTSAAGGIIYINGIIKTLSEAETELSSYLSTDVSGLVLLKGSSTSPSLSYEDVINLEIVL